MTVLELKEKLSQIPNSQAIVVSGLNEAELTGITVNSKEGVSLVELHFEDEDIMDMMRRLP